MSANLGGGVRASVDRPLGLQFLFDLLPSVGSYFTTWTLSSYKKKLKYTQGKDPDSRIFYLWIQIIYLVCK